MFDCETTESGNLYSQHAHGIMGLGRVSFGIVDQLNAQGAIASAFSLCYGVMDEEGGAMILGAILPSYGMVFTRSKNPSRSSYYNVVLRKIWTQGEPLPVKPSVFDGRDGTILDSGTTFAYLPEKHSMPSETLDLENLGSYFPSIDFVFGDDKMVAFAAENYLFRHAKYPGAYCLGFFQSEDPTTILGAIVVRNMLVAYNRENNQIGFLRTKCTKLMGEPSEERQASSANSTSSPRFGKADTEYEWNDPPPTSSPRPLPPGLDYPTLRWNNTGLDDLIPKRNAETSDASPSLAPLLSLPSLHFGTKCFSTTRDARATSSI